MSNASACMASRMFQPNCLNLRKYEPLTSSVVREEGAAARRVAEVKKKIVIREADVFAAYTA